MFLYQLLNSNYRPLLASHSYTTVILRSKLDKENNEGAI